VVQRDAEGAGPAAVQAPLGRLVRAHRARLGLTQEEVAHRAGLSERTLRNLEASRSSRPYPNTIRRLADALELTGRQRDQFEAAAPGVTPGLGLEGAVPCLLPPSVADFTGREEEVAAVLELLGVEGLQGAKAVVISAVAGKPGVGKTTLAVHVAHRLRGEFPDGQLYVNLQGAQSQPLEPGEVLARFLRALGLDGSSIPADLEERAERYRMLVAGRRVLVVLDNAADEAQVRPLLPGRPTCGVVVTSRARLTGLEGARLVDLDVLPLQVAVELLARVAGPARVAAEPDAAAAIVATAAACRWRSGSPGARLAARPAWSLARLAERLADERRRLDELLGTSPAGAPDTGRRHQRALPPILEQSLEIGCGMFHHLDVVRTGLSAPPSPWRFFVQLTPPHGVSRPPGRSFAPRLAGLIESGFRRRRGMSRRCRRGVGRRETGGKPDRADAPDGPRGHRVSARQGGCGRDRIRTCVGNAGDFTDRSLWPLGHPAGPRADDTGPHSRLTTTNLSRFQLEPDHVAGSVRCRRGVPVEGQSVEQLEAAAGDRDRAGAAPVERERGPAVVDLDVEEVGAEGDVHLEGADGLAGLGVQQRVGDGLVHQQPGRLVELGVAQQGGGNEPPCVRHVLEAAGELPREPHTSSHW
jgi:transcriptional regulator with XRE-family HTH domain/DNA polymerase III delta prime subunit